MNDHDLLIELKTEVQGIRDDIRELKDNMKTRVDDHEIRLRFIEKYVWIAIGAVAVLEIIGFFRKP